MLLIEPEITKHEFQGMRIGMSMLRSMLEQVQYMSADQIASTLDSSIGVFERSGIARTEGENDAVIMAHDNYYAGVRERHNLTTNWAVYETGCKTMGGMPYAGKYQMQYTDEHGNTYGPIDLEEDPSWLGLWKAADSLIVQSIDPEDKFIEGFEVQGNLIKVVIAKDD
jgi:hypothetical protein